MERINQPKGALEPQTDPLSAEVLARAAQLGGADLARDTNGQVQPHYQFVPRAAARLAFNSLATEPMLGLVRVASVMPARPDSGGRSAFVHIAWSDDFGPSHAAGRYPADRLFAVRVPAYGDRLHIRQAIDQAAWKRRDVPGAIARLIAAHLHLGPRSALYRFTVNGEVPDQLYDELNRISTSWEGYRPWAWALARYAVGREDAGPVPGWGPDAPEPRELAIDQAEPKRNGRRSRARARKTERSTTARKRVPVETAQRLIDAAFALGVAASRSEMTAAKARWLISQHAIGGPA